MKKSIIQGSITLLIFLGSWYSLSRIHWVEIFHTQEISESTDQKLGNLFWEFFKKSDPEVTHAEVTHPVDSIVQQICRGSQIQREKFKIHILKKDEPNAFALPNGHIILYTGLIVKAENPEELTGVMGHEIAHLELHHVMKKLAKEIGVSVLISMTTGHGGPDLIKEAAKMLSGTAFDRSLEKEADLKAVDYLVNAHVNPLPFADFLITLSKAEQDEPAYLNCIKTHPDSKVRADYIREYAKGKPASFKPILSQRTWEKLKATLHEQSENSGLEPGISRPGLVSPS